MKDQRKTDIKVGITVLIGLLALVWIFGWAKNFTLYSNQKTVTVEFETVSGLEKGDPVMVNGVREGFVGDITSKGNDAFASLVIGPDINLKEDASFSITMLDLMGGKKVEIKPGISKKELDYSKIQKGKFDADIATVMAMVGSVQGDLVKIIKDVQVTLASVNSLLTNKEFNNQIKTSVANLALISSKLNILIDENSHNLSRITKNTAELTEDVSSFVKENKEQIKNTFDNISLTIKSTNELLGKINSLTEETTNKENNIGKLLYDENLVNNLKTSLEQVKELTKILLEQLKDKGLNVDAKIKIF